MNPAILRWLIVGGSAALGSVFERLFGSRPGVPGRADGGVGSVLTKAIAAVIAFIVLAFLVRTVLKKKI